MSTPRLFVTARSARVSVHAQPVAAISVVGGSTQTVDGDVEVASSSNSVEVTVPEGTDVVIGVASGRVECRGPLGAVSVTSTSGHILVESAREVDARTASGRISVECCDEVCRVNAKSGRIEVGTAHTVEATTMSGRIDIESAQHTNTSAVSGSINIGSTGMPDIVAHTSSGTISITVPPGIQPTTRLDSKSGSIRCDCAIGDDGSIVVVTKSGAIRIESRQ